MNSFIIIKETISAVKMLHPYDFIGLFNQTVKKEIGPTLHQLFNSTENVSRFLNSFYHGT